LSDVSVFFAVKSVLAIYVGSVVRRSVAEPIAAQMRINVDVQPFP
jgi:hypothetical protein